MNGSTRDEGTTATGAVDWARAKELFLDAVDLDPVARDARIDAACSAEPALASAVRRLLAARDHSGGFLAEPEGPPERDDVPKHIGPYELLERIGEGGHGTVWRAMQHAPVQREVAVKVLKPGIDSPRLLRRFVDERTFLAAMDHPEVVKVYDAGATRDGRFFVAMELVRGEPLTAYADRRGLGVAGRVALAVRLCRAVHHAHQRAVIHRDLKPTNVLATDGDDGPRLRVIDFGIARALHEDNADRTRTLGGVGTPRYMSPEQHGLGPTVDTRTDIYAIGVILCELLSGDVPRSPSRDGTTTRTPATPPSRLARGANARRIPADLDRIVLRAVAWDPEDRYDSAAALADDLERFLRGEPVRAAPPSRAYQLRKFVARHRMSVATAAIVALVVLAALALAVRGRQEAEASRALAADAATRAERVTEFFLRDMVAATDPTISFAVQREPTIADLLLAVEEAVAAGRVGDRQAAFDMLARAAVAFAELRRDDDAARLAGQALAFAAQLGDSPPDRSLELEFVALESARPKDREQLALRRADLRRRAERSLGTDHPVTLRISLAAARDAPTPEDRLRALVPLASQRREQEVRYEAHVALADLHRAAGRVDEEIAARREVLAISERISRVPSTRTLGARYRLALALASAERIEEAAESVAPLLEIDDPGVPPHHPGIVAANYLALRLSQRLGEHARAIDIATAMLVRQRNAYGEDSFEHASALRTMGLALVAGGRHGEAVPFLEQALAACRSLRAFTAEDCAALEQALAASRAVNE